MFISAKKLWFLFIALAMIIVGYNLLKKTYDGPLFIEEPIQSDVGSALEIKMFQHEQIYTIHPLATYEIKAAVKHIEKYSTDSTSEISPIDFALVWGSLADPQVDEHIRYTQSRRWYHWSYDGEVDVSLQYISEHSANVHIIPANEEIEKRIMKINKEDFVHLKGFLVEVILPGGSWKSSLSRSDTGDGACEIFYVSEILSHND